jgi:hypothetical protein
MPRFCWPPLAQLSVNFRPAYPLNGYAACTGASECRLKSVDKCLFLGITQACGGNARPNGRANFSRSVWVNRRHRRGRHHHRRVRRGHHRRGRHRLFPDRQFHPCWRRCKAQRHL